MSEELLRLDSHLKEAYRVLFTSCSSFLPYRSRPGQFVFMYRVRIVNEAAEAPVKLHRRHWIVTDANSYQDQIRCSSHFPSTLLLCNCILLPASACSEIKIHTQLFLASHGTFLQGRGGLRRAARASPRRGAYLQFLCSYTHTYWQDGGQLLHAGKSAIPLGLPSHTQSLQLEFFYY